ncbi:hypothetical protein CYMTET_26406 [Cymbomonas tetramitiformis]|uniref:Uncharacterized protein n=1 Tax=Cymbomonas tetramitiformis TaxID=36881 RepID=A0AAE0FRS1_9CHLO|nr:hypothetical protein CYMTET_26406 [Cymbomonas tetramitiformis]
MTELTSGSVIDEVSEEVKGVARVALRSRSDASAISLNTVEEGVQTCAEYSFGMPKIGSSVEEVVDSDRRFAVGSSDEAGEGSCGGPEAGSSDEAVENSCRGLQAASFGQTKA